jgi:ribosome-binding factor A
MRFAITPINSDFQKLARMMWIQRRLRNPIRLWVSVNHPRVDTVSTDVEVSRDAPA